MNMEDRLIEDLMSRRSSYVDKKKKIFDNATSNNVEIDIATNKWNSAMSNSIHYQPSVPSHVRVTNEFSMISETIEEFNNLYLEEGYLVCTHFDGSLSRVHNFMSTIIGRFDIIQRNGCFISKALHKDLENLIFLVKKVLVTFKKLIEKSYDRSWIMEQTELQEFKRINDENMRQEIKRLEETQLIEERTILEREHKIKNNLESEKKRQKMQAEITKAIEQNITQVVEGVEVCTERPGGLKTGESAIAESVRSSNEIEDVFANMWRTNKMYCHNIRKTVNNICSQITNSNPQHTINRLNEILKFLKGDSIPLIGPEKGVYIDLKGHPEAFNLFWHLFYRAVLIQAETQFAVNTETTVAFASLAVSLFGSFPDQVEGLLKLVVDHYPVFAGGIMPLDVGDQVLVALKGVARFVAALEVALPPPGFKGCEGLSPAHLWRLLANMEAHAVQESVWAEAINGLLELGGHSLWHLYGHQFDKMLVALRDKVHVLPGISEIALDLMIDDVLSKKMFETQGYLSPGSWQ